MHRQLARRHYLFRDTLLRLVDADSMKYAELIAS